MLTNRSELIDFLTNYRIYIMSDKEIVDECPEAYGEELTTDHFNYLYDKFYDDYAWFDDRALVVYYRHVQNTLPRSNNEY